MGRPKRRCSEPVAASTEDDIVAQETAAAAPSKRRKTRKVADLAVSAASAADQPISQADTRKKRGNPKSSAEDDECADELDEEERLMMEEEEASSLEKETEKDAACSPNQAKRRVGVSHRPPNATSLEDDEKPHFFGEPIPSDEARRRWPHRYEKKSASNRTGQQLLVENQEIKACRHYKHANVDGIIYDLGDDVYVKAEDGVDNYIGKIIEFYEGEDAQSYFTSRWFFRAQDTAIGLSHAKEHDPRRVFLSEEKDVNVLDCIICKIKIVHIGPNINKETKSQLIADCDYYYNMSYSPAYSTFANLVPETEESSSDIEFVSPDIATTSTDMSQHEKESSPVSSLSLLDLYSGCGAMSTGLCLGSQIFGVNLETRWSVDYNEFACKSLQLNHPNAVVRHEKAEDFLDVIREWKKLCDRYVTMGSSTPQEDEDQSSSDDDQSSNDVENDTKTEPEVYEVDEIIGICFGDPQNTGEVGLKFKVHWKGYDESEDSWEPLNCLDNCDAKIRSFVLKGYVNRILPLPNTVDVICGGPPCQGISGFNRFRNREDPLKDEKNKQMLVFMDIVEFLRPKFVLMENVVDILKFSDGFLGRFALSRLVNLNYQARLGMMAAGFYGLPQFRLRVFIWGALPTEILPQYPLPTHNVISFRGVCPLEFEQNLVGVNDKNLKDLKKALTLQDALTDLPAVENNENRDIMDYSLPPQTEFQQFIRSTRKEMLDFSFGTAKPMHERKLFDHRPLKLTENDHHRVCLIPKEKGANFRNLPGLRIHENVVELDPNVPREYLPDGKPLVPDYAISFIKGKSLKPFGRLWWDETVPTVVGRAEPHNQAILHPSQNRVLTIRENARLQGFPDYYRLVGPVKQRYIQVGNAVAVPVARALGYALAQASRGITEGDAAVFTLPSKFSTVSNDDAEAVVG